MDISAARAVAVGEVIAAIRGQNDFRVPPGHGGVVKPRVTALLPADQTGLNPRHACALPMSYFSPRLRAAFSVPFKMGISNENIFHPPRCRPLQTENARQLSTLRHTGQGVARGAVARLWRAARDARIQIVNERRSRPISRVLSWAIIPLGRLSPDASSDLPGNGAGRALVSLFGLAPGGVCPATAITNSAVRSYRTFSPLPSRAVCFLWHFPSAHAVQMLSGASPSGARTFLHRLKPAAIAWPTPRASLLPQSKLASVVLQASGRISGKTWPE